MKRLLVWVLPLIEWVKKTLPKIEAVLKKLEGWLQIAEKEIERVYAWLPDVPDQRDKNYLLIKAERSDVSYPPYIDLRSYCTEVKDQGNLGSCTAFASIGDYEILENIEKEPTFDFSELFQYYNERVIDGDVNQDAGSSLRTAIKALAKYGACPEKDSPYNIKKFKTKPSKKAYIDAAVNKIVSYFRLNGLDDMKHCLADGFPFIFGMSVYESFESDQVLRTGVVPLPQPDERCLGGHALCCVGYDDRNQVFIVRNSWGMNTGDHGYLYIPYAYLSNTNLADDFWTIRK